MILWSVNDKFSSLYEKKSSSSIKTASSYNPSSYTPEKEQSVFERFLQSQPLYKSEQKPLVIPQMSLNNPSPQSPSNSPPQGFNPPLVSQQFIPPSPEGPPPTLPTQVERLNQQSPPPTPPTPIEGFSQQSPPPAISPQITDILTELKGIKNDLEEIKEEKSETSGGSSPIDNILDVEKDKPSEEENIKGGSTKKINIKLN